MDLDKLISDDDLKVESSLLKDPYNEEIWFQYLNDTSNFQKKMFIIERAVRFNSSHKLWIYYIDIIVNKVEQLSYVKHQKSYRIANRVFQRCLAIFPQDLDIWRRYFKLLNLQADVPFIINQYIESLRVIDIKHHLDIWNDLLEFLDKIAVFDKKIAGNLRRRFLSLDQYDISHVYKYIQWSGDLDLFYQEERTFEDWDHILPLGDETFCLNYIRRFPDQYSKGYLALISITQDENRKAYYFNEALDHCTTIYDFSQIYEEYLEFREPDENSSDFEIDQYEKLLSSRSLLVNDIYLRQNKNNLDVWFKRFELFEDDLPQLLKTYVEAITAINPLTCFSESNTYKLSDIWIQYAKVYGDRGDLNTVDLIYSKSVESKFKSEEEIVDIYKAWSKVFEATDIEKSIGILEKVLFNKNCRYMKLWEYYFEVLEVNIDDISRITNSYYKMIELKCATPLMIIQFGTFLEAENNIEAMFNIFDTAINEFKDDEIRFELYNIYIVKLMNHSKDLEKIRDVFDQCLTLSIGDKLRPVIILYSEFEFKNSLVIKSFNLLNDFVLKYPSTAIIKILLERFSFDKPNLRNQFSKWLELNWSSQDFAALCIELARFEINEKQVERARTIFKLLHESIPYDFKQWEEFELNYGDEAGFKEMLRIKRDTKIIPKGFVRATDNSNPEEIDIDM